MKYCAKCGAHNRDEAQFCTSCGTKAEVPPPLEDSVPPSADANLPAEDVIKFGCPACEQSLEAPRELAGSQIDCPTCRKQILIPIRQPPGALPAASAPPSSARRRRKLLLVSVVAALLGALLTGAAIIWRHAVADRDAPLASGMLARVGDWSISLDEFNQRLAAAKKQVPELDDKDAALRKRILEEVFTQHLLAHGARELHLDKKKEIVDATRSFQTRLLAQNDRGINVKRATRDFEHDLLVKEYVNLLTKDVRADDSEARAYYEANANEFVKPDGEKVAFVDIKQDLLKALTQQKQLKAVADKCNELKQRVVNKINLDLLG